LKRRRVIVRGRVQGVFFRDSINRLATELGVAGWVRNRGDGSVEAVFEGDPKSIDRLVELCREGPPGAEVESVDTSDEEPRGEQGFTVG
jgi:acylphosphatase